MIVGVGVDIAEVDFWRQAVRDPTTSVIEGTFTAAEQKDARAGVAETAQRFATRFAAKKLFESDWYGKVRIPPMRNSIALTDIEVLSDAWVVQNSPFMGMHSKSPGGGSSFNIYHFHMRGNLSLPWLFWRQVRKKLFKSRSLTDHSPWRQAERNLNKLQMPAPARVLVVVAGFSSG